MAMVLRVPRVKFTLGTTVLAPRPATLAGLRVGYLDGWSDQQGGMYPRMTRIAAALADYGVVDTVWQVKPGISSPVPEPMLAEFAAQVDVVVNGEGLCGSCTAATILDAIRLEALGKPTITIVQNRFETVAKTLAADGGLPGLRLIVESAPQIGNINQESGPLAVEDLATVLAALCTEENAGRTREFALAGSGGSAA